MEVTQVMLNCQIISMHGVDIVVSYTSPLFEVENGEITKVYDEWSHLGVTEKHLNAALLKLGLGSIADMTRAEKEEYFKSKDLI